MDESNAVTSSRLLAAWRAWGVGLSIALLGAAGLVALALREDAYGWALVFGAPVVIGFALGYGLRVPRGMRIVLGLLLLVSLVGGLMMSGLSGLICGLIFVFIAAGPTVVGVVVGGLLRRKLDPKQRSRNPFLPVLLFLAVGAAMMAEQRLTPELPAESVVTRRVLDLSPGEAWDRLVFYEDVPLPPPLLARLGIPHPLRTAGRIARRGDVKLCLYSTGHLRKRVTELRPGRLLAFDVIEQLGVEERSAELLSGSFRFAPAAGGGTEVVLTTTYRPLLQARPVWRPFERAVARVLHQHVLDGMEAVVPAEPRLLADTATR